MRPYLLPHDHDDRSAMGEHLLSSIAKHPSVLGALIVRFLRSCFVQLPRCSISARAITYRRRPHRRFVLRGLVPQPEVLLALAIQGSPRSASARRTDRSETARTPPSGRRSPRYHSKLRRASRCLADPARFGPTSAGSPSRTAGWGDSSSCSPAPSPSLPGREVRVSQIVDLRDPLPGSRAPRPIARSEKIHPLRARLLHAARVVLGLSVDGLTFLRCMREGVGHPLPRPCR